MPAFEKYQWLSACSGIEIHIQPGNSYSLRYCSVSVEKDSLSITEKKEWLQEEGLSFTKLDKSKPVALTVTGKGILVKKVAKLEAFNPAQLNQYFPNLKAEDFYAQNFISGSDSYIAIVRRELIDGIVDKARKAGLQVLQVSVGPFAASHILRQLNFYNGQAVFDGHVIHYSKEFAWESYKYDEGAKNEFPLKLGIEPIKEELVLAYATAFQLALYHRLEVIELGVESIQQKLKEFSENQKFRFRLAFVLMSAFILLLVNFLVFSHYNEENAELSSKVSSYNASAESLQKLSKSISESESLLKGIGWYKGKSYAQLSSVIAKNIPAGIVLTELLFNPMDVTESNRQRKEIYLAGTVKLKGEAKDLEAVNEWLYNLKQKESATFSQVILNSFSSAQEGNNKVFELTLKY